MAWLRCNKCKVVDKTRRVPDPTSSLGWYLHVGTSVKMECPTCLGMLCRSCCATEHGTRMLLKGGLA